MSDLLFYQSDVWELSGVALAQIKRKFVAIDFIDVIDFQINVAIIESETQNAPTLVMFHDYLNSGCLEWHSYIKRLKEEFRLVIPDLGSYGANTRIQSGHIETIMTCEGAERLMLEWFEKWMTAMGSDLPATFMLTGIANGAYQAGLLAAKHPERIEKLLLLAPSKFCPEATSSWNPYKEEGGQADCAHMLEHFGDSQHDVIQRVKASLEESNSDLSQQSLKTMAHYKARVILDRDFAQKIYLQAFVPNGRAFNPLRLLLADPDLPFSIAVMCGADGVGGNSDCVDFIPE